MRALLIVVLLLVSASARAEEGMWLFTDFPSEEVKKAYGFGPDAKWLQKVRLGSVRLAGGCSASFVSPQGLVMTNHHCIRSCIQDLATPKNDLLEKGFLARTAAQERRCPGVEANQLVEITDVTARVHKATAGREGAAFHQAFKAERANLERACATDAATVRCDLVTLFHGGRYQLYKYRRFQDVRLAFAPEFPMAAFGGDPDNFNFPRYAFDVAFLRVYQDGKPAQTPEHLPWSQTAAKEGDLVFISGHPGGTERVQTTEQLAFQRDVALPYHNVMLAELRGTMLEFQKKSPQLHQDTRARLRSVENALKALRGRHTFLGDPAFFTKKVQADQALRQKVEADPKLRQKFGPAFGGIAAAIDAHRRIYVTHRQLEGGDAFRSDLFTHARRLVRAAAERPLPDAERLSEFTEAQLPSVRQQVERDAPVPRELEILTLSFSLRRLQETLGADDPIVRKVLGRESPDALARKLITGTRLGDAKVRRVLYEGGQAAIDASKDPLILLAKSVEPEARAVRKVYEEQVEAALKKNGELLNQAHVAAYGTSGYPDATFTLRLSYGQVKGWTENGRNVPAMTTVAGLFDRHTGRFPFAVAPTWLGARKQLSPQMPMNMATTNDIIGGNSGSPVVNRDGRVVGLIFDGNLPSLAGRYGYDPAMNRAVAVHGDAILAGLRSVYGASRIAEEISAAAKPD